MTDVVFSHSRILYAAARQRTGSTARRWWTFGSLAVVILLAAVLRLVNIDAIGDGNTYYTATVKSMLVSWKNFFYVAAEPGGSVSVDKPPLGFWLQTISAYFLGVNGFAVTLPQIIAGIVSVPLLYGLVRRQFGHEAGLLAALVLATTPVTVAVDRNNTVDSTLILALLLAAWAFVRATQTGRRRYLLIGAVLVGLGFNIKMLQAYLPLPAFYAVYGLGARLSWRVKLRDLLIATAVLLIVSLAWAVAVDLTPADQRPYVGSSDNNSVINLIIGYNGLSRLLGMDHDQAPAGQMPFGQLPAGSPPNGAPQPSGGGQTPLANGFPPFAGNLPAMMGGGPGVVSETGSPGVWRLFSTPLVKEVGWLLPLALIALGGGLLVERPRWPLSPVYVQIVLWGGWLLTGVIFFSKAEFFHAYYLALLAPAVAALVAIGISSLWALIQRRRWPGIGLLTGVTAGSLAFQVHILDQYSAVTRWWLTLAAALIGIGLAVFFVGLLRRSSAALSRAAGGACLVAALLITPTVWAWNTTLDESPNVRLPSAYAGTSEQNPMGRGDFLASEVNPELLAYLEAHTQGVEYLLAVSSSMQGDPYVLATGRPVLLMGGFNGQDEVVTADDLAEMVADGRLKYILSDGLSFNANPEIAAWIESACEAVTEITLTFPMPTLPGGGMPGIDNQTLPGGVPGMQPSLMACSAG